MEAEKDIIEYVRAGKLALPPLSFALVSQGVASSDSGADLLVETTWKDGHYVFAGEVKRYSSDKTVQEAADQARQWARALSVNPLVIVPWLSNEQLLSLESRGVSGIDLCGNGVIMIPGKMLVFRTGQPNKFPTSRPIRRVYQGTSSLVARVFMMRPEYASVSEILDEITARGGNITLPTVSKALKQLEEDIVVERSKGLIRLLQPDKLLDRLQANYEQPKPRDYSRCKVTAGKNANISTVLRKAAEKAKEKLVLSGESSVNFYATMATDPLQTFYCTEFATLELERFGAQIDPASRFPNVEFIKTDQETVFFDMRQEAGGNVASPLQAYLELSASDKRGQETALQIRQQLLDNLTKPKRRGAK